jgi:hypothetical protein
MCSEEGGRTIKKQSAIKYVVLVQILIPKDKEIV